MRSASPLTSAMSENARPEMSLKPARNRCWSPTPTPMRSHPCHATSQMRSSGAVAEKGGIIGPSIYGPLLWDGESTRPPTLDDYFSHVEHIAELVGIEHVGFGTDFPAVSEEWMVYAGPPSPRTWNAIVRYGEVFGHSTRCYLSRGGRYPGGLSRNHCRHVETRVVGRRCAGVPGWKLSAGARGYLERLTSHGPLRGWSMSWMLAVPPSSAKAPSPRIASAICR